jgi:hypothetical protein
MELGRNLSEGKESLAGRRRSTVKEKARRMLVGSLIKRSTRR